MLSQPSPIELDLADDQKLIVEIENLLLEKLSIRVKSPETDLLDTGALDSMAMVHLLLHLENHFGIDLPLGTLGIDPFRSVSRIAGLVKNLR